MDEDRERQKKEEEYWRQHHTAQPYATKEYTFEHYQPAYGAGVDAYSAYPDRNFEDFIDEVALNYERENPDSGLPWDQLDTPFTQLGRSSVMRLRRSIPIVGSAPVFDFRVRAAPGARSGFRGNSENDRAGD
jgi:hypothetical protein